MMAFAFLMLLAAGIALSVLHVSLMGTFLALQLFVVLFIALHDWVPLGSLNDVKAAQAADGRVKLFVVTALSTLPFAICLVGTAIYARSGFPQWLWWTLWLSYAGITLGAVRAWWLPYLWSPNPARAVRYQAMFSQTHAFLPVRNGIRPNTLHVTLHIVIVATVILLAVMSLGQTGMR